MQAVYPLGMFSFNQLTDSMIPSMRRLNANPPVETLLNNILFIYSRSMRLPQLSTQQMHPYGNGSERYVVMSDLSHFQNEYWIFAIVLEIMTRCYRFFYSDFVLNLRRT